jgi:hypothetical protein
MITGSLALASIVLALSGIGIYLVQEAARFLEENPYIAGLVNDFIQDELGIEGFNLGIEMQTAESEFQRLQQDALSRDVSPAPYELPFKAGI